MSLEMTIVMLIAAWLAVASAMLWGVMRIARRHHHPSPAPQAVKRLPASQAKAHPAPVH